MRHGGNNPQATQAASYRIV